MLNRDAVTTHIARQTSMRVQSGPFKGMLLSHDKSWGDGDLAPKLLGTYEQELHDAVFRLASKKYGAIVDIGSAEGYYAVGLARLFRSTKVFAFDVDARALSALARNAQINGVSVEVGGICSAEQLITLAHEYQSILLVSDCEGFEVELFGNSDHQLRMQEALQYSDLIIECHDFVNPVSTALCYAVFGRSHHIMNIFSGGRNPSAFPFLGSITEVERWMAVCENRPCVMNWTVCESRQLTPS